MPGRPVTSDPVDVFAVIQGDPLAVRRPVGARPDDPAQTVETTAVGMLQMEGRPRGTLMRAKLIQLPSGDQAGVVQL
jgi:hypothetical protein